MAITWKFDSSNEISFDDAVSYLDSQGSSLFKDNLAETSSVLWSLRNNRSFVTKKVLSVLEKDPAEREKLLYTPQVMILHIGSYYFMRLCIWHPNEKKRSGEEIFFYEEPHDHNFSFFTTNYCGPGYRTIIYEYDNDDVTGYSGEAVDMSFSEDSILEPGKVMLFRSGVDIHTQFPPEAPSISLNIMEKRQLGEEVRAQFMFDINKLEITKRLTAYNAETLIGLISPRSEDLSFLSEIATNTTINPYVRLRAIDAIAEIDGELKARMVRANPSCAGLKSLLESRAVVA